MADTNTQTGLFTGGIDFIRYHKPTIGSGDYRIDISQNIAIKKKGSNAVVTEENFRQTRNFSVIGDRFTLDPQVIHSVFPPAGSMGDYSSVFPHIILKRSTLPWERMITEGNSTSPWLALLLFDIDEAPRPETKSVKEWISQFVKKSPCFKLETGQSENDTFTVIEVKKELIKEILPSKECLDLMAHVRCWQKTEKSDMNNSENTEFAVIFGNRLPLINKTSVVHLVSLEYRYNGKGEFILDNDSGSDSIGFISLANWRFTCQNENENFSGLLKNIGLNTLRLPKSTNPEAERFLSRGYVALPHFLRQGSQTTSWYHGPLITGSKSTGGFRQPPFQTSDHLLIYNGQVGMFDVSYAAAWELGRMQALCNKTFAVNLYQWKRNLAHCKRKCSSTVNRRRDYAALQKLNDPEPPLPAVIKEFFGQLRLLKNIPFNYLVPDERMLPNESIRFFHVDPFWMHCLLDGAFSIGRVGRTETEADSDLIKDSMNGNKNNRINLDYPLITGFFLRSAVVSGWPDLQVNAYSDSVSSSESTTREKLSKVRMDRIGKNVLICLFEGEINTVDIYQTPETLHFGLNKDNGKFIKKLRGQSKAPLQIDDPSFWSTKDKRIIKHDILANKMKESLKLQGDFTSAHFVAQMIEGGEMVRFQRVQ